MIFLIEDTRQKDKKHENIHRYCEQNGIKIIPQYLKVGDYEIVGNSNKVVDTKKDMSELLSCLSGDQKRFYRECDRALQLHKKLTILVENCGLIKSIEDVADWKNPNYSNSKLYMNGRRLMDEIYKCKVMFGTQFAFCGKDDTGKTLIDILTH